MPKVSVIVPCYNVEKYVVRCLDSLIKQTLRDIEIICIDDKSTDGTLNILKKYADLDSRIKLFAQSTNAGVAVARNIGLENATGEYIGFVDPDDYVDLDFYEKLYNKAKENSAYVVQGQVFMTDTKTGQTYKHWIYEAVKESVIKFSSAFWSALYKFDFLRQNNIYFPAEIRTSQDSVFLTRVALLCNDIKQVEGTYYHYFFQRPDSLDSAFLSRMKAQSKYNAFSMNLDFIVNANLDKRLFQEYVWNHVVRHIIYEIGKKYECDTDHKQMFDLLVKVRNEYDIKKFIDSKISKNIRNHIKNNDFDGLRKFLVLARRRIYLFGIIPFIKIDVIEDTKYIILFDLLPLLKIQKQKVWLFNFILLLKFKR